MWSRRVITDAHGRKTLRDCVTVGSVAVADEVIRRFIPGEGIGDLAGDPLRRGIGRHAERYQATALMPEDDQNEEQLEADRRHDQEVHGGDAGRMIVKESLPVCDRPRPLLAMYLATVDCATSIPSFTVRVRHECAARPTAGWTGSSLGSTDGSPLEPLADRHESATSSASTAGNPPDAIG